ncbi:hypothetical protein COLO4_38324 [Corchorus olitorius]|uniref:Uncharacterized protein n=1 Tax=Corchorus olitorius TaxID=93759 RepID=A0A1R3FVQ7_9ROSI|nr:hypothetical protein COLO4_38324 [Corchorus olitorius]
MEKVGKQFDSDFLIGLQVLLYPPIEFSEIWQRRRSHPNYKILLLTQL